jgi:hypothetical protein
MTFLVALLVGGLVLAVVGVKLLICLVILPFKILGLLAKGLGSLVGVLFGVVGLVAAVLIVPLLPIVILGGLVWLIVRAARPKALPGEVRIVRG